MGTFEPPDMDAGNQTPSSETVASTLSLGFASPAPVSILELVLADVCI